METLTGWFVDRPLNILAVAAVLLGSQLALQAAGRQSRALLVGVGAWALYAAWEWFVQTRTPEANIRVDLLLIWPILVIVTVVALIRAVR
jgi:hypothetical protein